MPCRCAAVWLRCFGALDGVEIVGEAEEPAAAFAGIDSGAADLVVRNGI